MTVDRASKESIRLDEPFVSVCGTTQPGVLENLFRDKTSNGLTDRILFVWPDKIGTKKWQTGEVDSRIFVPYNKAITKLLDDRPEESNELRFTDEAATVFGNFYDNLQRQIDNEPNERVQSLLSKLDTHCARLSLLVQLLRYACGEASNRKVDEVSVHGAIKLIGYFQQQAQKVNQHLFERSPVDDLDQTKRQFYEALPEVFATQEAVALGESEKYNIPERTVKRFLTNQKLFGKIGHGRYGKLL